jgi:putative transposase
MARQPLIHVPDGIYSVTSKCNNAEFHFNADEKFDMYLEHLLECKRKLGFEIYDIACMSNHVHELYRIPKKNVTIADILQRVKGHFSRRFNLRYGRRDHFWRNKPFYRVVEDEQYAFHIMNYNHWNAVRAGLVSHPAEWPYSGYRFHILGERTGIIGRLLSTIPGVDISEEILLTSHKLTENIQRLLQNKRLRFIGKESLII